MKCSSGKIKRRSYKTKKGSKVKSSCVKDRGRKGKTPKNRKVLPPLKNDIHLSKYGYSIRKTSEERRRSLLKAVKKHDTIEVLRRLVLISNYQAKDKENKRVIEKFRSDIEFMRDLYRQSKDRNH